MRGYHQLLENFLNKFHQRERERKIESVTEAPKITHGAMINVTKYLGHSQCDQKKSPNVYKSCPKLISLEKL